MLCCVCFTFVNVTSATNIAERSSLLATVQSYQSVREPGTDILSLVGNEHKSLLVCVCDLDSDKNAWKYLHTCFWDGIYRKSPVITVFARPFT